MIRHRVLSTLTLLIVLLAAVAAPAQNRPALGDVYEDQTAGIAFRPPAGMRRVQGRGGPERVVEFTDPDRQWTLRVDLTTYTEPMRVTAVPGGNPGVMDLTVQQFTEGQVHVEVLRQDLVNLGALDMGLLAMRYGPTDNRRLAQQAIIRANPLVFYTITFNSRTNVLPPSPERDDSEVDPVEQQAVEIFSAVIDTVQILDRRHIKEEQDTRLLRTRAMLPNFNERRMSEVLVEHQWFRVIRDGKDIGYSYVVEEPYTYGVFPGFVVVTRSRLLPREGVQIDTASSMFLSYDREHEFWTTNSVLKDGQRTQDSSETATSDQRRRPVVVRRPLTDAPAGERSENRGVQAVPEYLLSVSSTIGRTEQEPIIRHLPPYYLPRALHHLLPRLLPLKEPRGYLFVSYVSEQRELMFRYIDVEPEAEVDILGKRVRAVPVYDRIGLKGTPTIHYMTMEGTFLGSKTTTGAGTDEESTTWVVPTDAQTLQSLWKDADVSRPDTRLPGQNR